MRVKVSSTKCSARTLNELPLIARMFDNSKDVREIMDNTYL